MKKLMTVTLLLILIGSVQAQEKSNVLLIVSDDHGYADFSYKEIDDKIKTPNLDQLTYQKSNIQI